MACPAWEATLPVTMTMKPHLDYATNYDDGTDATAAIQPVINGEAASQGVFRRPSENLRGRSETLRSALDEMFYFRDRPHYLLECSGTGKLSWGGTVALGGSGVLDNTTELRIRPLGGANANVKGAIGIGTAGTNRVDYTVTAGTYATHGVNRWRIEHRSVTGQSSIQVQISAGPNYLILVTFDDANTSHDAFAVAVAVNLAIAANSGTAGKVLAAADAIASNPCLDSDGPVNFLSGVVSSTISGTPTVDIETHILPAGALGTLTTGTPLVEGATIIVAYRDLIEPSAGDALDPKAGLAGGRAESNPARSNTDVTANLVILTGAVTDGLHLSGCIPLVRITNGVARFIDGTSILGGYASAPGTSMGTQFDPSVYSGPTTLTNNGGLLTTDDTIEEAFVTTDAQLARRRAVTWTVTNDDDSVGGDFDASTAVQDAISACSGTGGHILVRRGTYTGLATNLNVSGITLEGEEGTQPEWVIETGDLVFTGALTIRNMKLTRMWGVTLTVNGSMRLENCEVDTGLFLVQGGEGSYVELVNCTMLQTGQAATPIYGMGAQVERLSVRGGVFTGPDSTVAAMSATPDTRPAVFDVDADSTKVEIVDALIASDVRAGWVPVSSLSSNDRTGPDIMHFAAVNGGEHRRVAGDWFAVGRAADLSSARESLRYSSARTNGDPEPSRVVFHPATELDFALAPGSRTPPNWRTPELELLQITDPRDVSVAGYVELPASVTLTDLAPNWRVDFATDARGTLARMTEGDVIEIVESGFYGISRVNLDAPTGSIVLCELDGRSLAATPPAGTQVARYYRVIRGHNGGMAGLGNGTSTYDPADPDMDFLDSATSVDVEHHLTGGVRVVSDRGGGLVVGRVRTDLSPTGATRHFTPDFVVSKAGITSFRDAFVKTLQVATATVTTLLGVGTVLDVEAAILALQTAVSGILTLLGDFDGSSGEWNYGTPLSFSMSFDPTRGQVMPGSTATWSYDVQTADAAYPYAFPTASGTPGQLARYRIPLPLPRDYVITSLVVTFYGDAPLTASATVELFSTAGTTVVATNTVAVAGTYADNTVTPGSPLTVGSNEYSIHVFAGFGDTANLRIAKVVVNGTIAGPR